MIDLVFDKEKLTKLLKSFHTLTGMRIVIFDKNQEEVASWPEQDGYFCRLVQSSRMGKACCKSSNEAAFRHCENDDSLYTYHCHAGLIESMISLKHENALIGYIMYGQISNEKMTIEQCKKFQQILSTSLLQKDEVNRAIETILIKNDDEVLAASHILLVLGKYAIQEKILSLSKNAFIKELDSYIENHMGDVNLSVSHIADHFQVGRTKLYEITKRILPTSLAHHIQAKRLIYAKKLLIDTDFSITDITDKVGFYDYNYFCRIFRKINGVSPREFRKNHSVN